MDAVSEDRDGIRIGVLTSNGEVDDLLALLEGIAAELGWQPGQQLRSCRHEALHLAVSRDGAFVGGLQAVAGSQAHALPYRSVWPDVSMEDADTALHVTMLALRREYRGSADLFWPLCIALCRWCQEQDISAILLEATPGTLRVYRRLGWPLEVIGDLRQHWGEDCYLCRMDMDRIEQAARVRAQRSPRLRALLTGITHTG